jgi:hypothetical protein
MSNEVSKPEPRALDNFADFDDSIEGDDDGRMVGTLVGTRLKFTNEARWEDPEGNDYTDRVLLASNIRRTEVKWGADAPLEVRELAAGEKYRDLESLNETVPKSEWRKGFDGQLRGPWQRQHVLEFCDLETMERFSWPTSTIGGSIAIHELVDRIMLKRKFYRRLDIYPLVKLAQRHMKTKYGGRERPHLEVKDWKCPENVGGGGSKIEGAQQQALSQMQSVPEPSLAEEMKDSLPF